MFEEELQPLGLQDGPQTLATGPRRVSSVGALAAFKAAISEIKLGDGAATLADKQWTRPKMPPKTSAKPTQRYWLNISAVVIYLDSL
jgi:hypothetical protein